MGGDTVSPPSSIVSDDDDDELSTTKPEFRETLRDYHKTLEIEANEKRVYAQLIKSYDDLKDRVENMEVAKRKVLSYTPGSWVGNIGDMTQNVPKTTTLLLIGPKGSGKSSLVNRISRVFEDDKFAPERAQVTYNSSIRDGTRFLQEYMIPRNSTSFCLYDTRGFSDSLFENLQMIKQWMTKGVRHGELVNSDPYSSCSRGRMDCETRQDELLTYERRRVDFVIFVVNGLSVLKCMDNSGADTLYMYRVTQVFNSPFLSFKDHKPVIAITHGDLLSISERACVRAYLGDLLGVHPIKQTFDIPDNREPITELTIVDLVRYALEHADRNLPCKSRPTIRKGSTILLCTHLLLLLAVGILMLTVHFHGFHSPKLNSEIVLEPSLEIKKVMEFDQESAPKPDLGIKNVTEIDSEIVPVPTLEIKEVTELIKKATELIKKVMEFDQESDPTLDPRIKKVTEIDSEIVPVPTPEIKKVTDFDQVTALESDMEIKKATKIDDSDLESKKVTEIVSERIVEMKKVNPGSILKPSKKAKKVDVERTPGKKQKMKNVRSPEPNHEIDWKTIRHLWYEEPNQEIDWKTIRHLWYDL